MDSKENQFRKQIWEHFHIQEEFKRKMEELERQKARRENELLRRCPYRFHIGGYYRIGCNHPDRPKKFATENPCEGGKCPVLYQFAASNPS